MLESGDKTRTPKNFLNISLVEQKKECECEAVRDVPKPVRNLLLRLDILVDIDENPHKTTPLTTDYGTSQSSILRAFKCEKYHPY